MQTQTIERLKLMHELWARNLSDTTIEAIVQIMESMRTEQGHSEAEAKEIRELIETGISEAELLKTLNQIR